MKTMFYTLIWMTSDYPNYLIEVHYKLGFCRNAIAWSDSVSKLIQKQIAGAAAAAKHFLQQIKGVL